MNTDRRRINAPSGGTSAPVFARTVKEPGYLQSLRPTRTRGPNELRKIFLQTSLVPSASGSAYLEIPTSTNTPTGKTLIPPTSSLKITASIQGPKPLPRSAPFSPSLLLTTTVKFAPFATRHRRGYIRDSVERDLGVHVETALRGVIIGERWPKSGVEVVITVVEGDEDAWWGDASGGGSGNGDGGGWGLLNVLAGCITVASAAIADAGIDCVDMVSGGVAAIIKTPNGKDLVKILDPCPAEHQNIVAACAVGYLAGRDEITELWMKGDVGADPEELIEGATHAAVGSLSVMKEVILEGVEAKFKDQLSVNNDGLKRKQQDVEMSG
ncbi:3' exoribonuclease family, domain 1-domain-containing protein [Massariosphaeria phaeospora]|uniref:3' exoribonuclease family, domain 1-domain-containing protein n=1 Tax=Massariosphaeria phaeospora TaxID=100035 RepID=A0A7C8MEK9_9PLEO|nr:3' exoribonuclease family, domain 1-domain-containing protein [Massariosphaeria phaeospora]